MTQTLIEPNNLDYLLHDHNRGKTMRLIGESLAELVQNVRKYGKGGELTIKLKIAPANGSDASQSSISISHQVKSPGGTPFAAIYFTSEEGAVSKQDPDQPEFPAMRTLHAPLEAMPAVPAAVAIPAAV